MPRASTITVPLKIDKSVSVGWGKTSTLGASGSVAGLALALAAYLAGDHSQQTTATIIAGVLLAASSLLATLMGRYGQAKAAAASVPALSVENAPHFHEAATPLHEAVVDGYAGPSAQEVADRLEKRLEVVYERLADNIDEVGAKVLRVVAGATVAGEAQDGERQVHGVSCAEKSDARGLGNLDEEAPSGFADDDEPGDPINGLPDIGLTDPEMVPPDEGDPISRGEYKRVIA